MSILYILIHFKTLVKFGIVISVIIYYLLSQHNNEKLYAILVYECHEKRFMVMNTNLIFQEITDFYE